MTKLTRGLRNKNPGNIDRDGTPWQGMAKDQSSDPRFIVFDSAPFGIRAMARVLITYQDKHGLATVCKIINRWAPPVENNTEAYVQAVAAAIGVETNDIIDVHQHAVMLPLVKAIIKHENGVQPYAESVINYGLSLAGVTPRPNPKPISKSKTVIGSGIATAGTAVGAVVDQVKDSGVQQAVATIAPADTALETVQSAQDAVSYTMGLWEWAGIACAVLAIVGIGLVLYAKWDRHRKGIE